MHAHTLHTYVYTVCTLLLHACLSMYTLASPTLHAPSSRSTEAKTETLTIENPHASEGEGSFESSPKEGTGTTVPLAEGAVEEEEYVYAQTIGKTTQLPYKCEMILSRPPVIFSVQSNRK